MDRFIIGTGRCGSTLLSKMLDCSPEMTSIFEFFNGLPGDRRFSPQPMTAEELWEVVTAPHPFVTEVLRRGYEVEEVAYPFDQVGARFSRQDTLPWILVATLPRMSEDPDRFFDETRSFVMAQPTQSPTEHYRDLFAWFAARNSATMWNERSGSGIDSAEELAAAFPEGRFLHIHRDGTEAALSMREHAAFRLAVTLVYDLDPDLDLVAALSSDSPAPTSADAFSRALARRPPAEHFGRFWSDQLAAGYRALRWLRPEQYMEISFEDLVGSPGETLGEISKFFAMDPDLGNWRREAAGLVRGFPPSRVPALSGPERVALEEVCRTGNLLLGREPSVREAAGDRQADLAGEVGRNGP